jgi:3-hydroxyisobutyrate dehydrogenase-like beta-hydroxyacid dehydrogenase
MEAMGEAVAMMRKSGVDPAAAIEMLSKTIFSSPVYQGYGPAIALGRFTPAGFRLPLGLKDIELALETSRAVNAPMPTASLLRDRFVSAIAKGRADLDWSAIALGAADDAGLKESR